MSNVRTLVANVTATVAVVLLLVACGDGAEPRSAVTQAPGSAAEPAARTFLASQVREIHDDIQARTDELRTAGADVAALRVDDAAKVVVVTLRGDVRKGTTVLHARYPREALRIQGGDVAH